MAMSEMDKAIARSYEAARQKKFYENQAKQTNARATSKLELYGSPEAVAKRTADAQKQREKEFQERQAIAPTYRDSYEVGEITSFEEAKQAADETYLQYWYDRANEISNKWEDEDYALVAEPQYEKYKHGPRHIRTRRVVPEGYDEYVEAQERINAGPLDFSSKETHLELIKPPQVKHRGYGKRQYWIDESNPLRQAVEAQANVMKGFLDDAGVPIVQKYEDLEGFKRPDSFRGEGIYLNTGTGAHIDWDAGLKRMQQYQSSPDAELGTYSNVFVRPDPEGIAKPLAFVGVPAVKQIAGAVGDMLPNIDLPESQLLSDIGDALEPVVDAVRAGGRAFDDAVLQPINQNIVKPFEQAGREFDDKFVDPIDDVIDTFGSEVVDPALQASSDVLSEVEDGLKEVGYFADDLIDWERLLKGALGGMLAGGVGGQQSTAQRTPTQTEGLFDRELFKFDLDDFNTTKDLLYSENSRKYG
jgi:hypothetical protein